MRIFLVPVGEQTKPLYEGFKYAGNIDMAVFICSDKTRAFAEDLAEWSSKMVDDCRIVETDARDVGKIIEDVVSRVPQTISPGSEIVSNLSGGTKPMSFACYILSSFMKGSSFYIFLTNDGSMEFVGMPRLNVCIGEMVGEGRRGGRTRIRILKHAMDGASSLSDLSKKLSVKKPAILRHIKKLQDAGLVSYQKSRVSVTETGKLVLRMKEIRERAERMNKLS